MPPLFTVSGSHLEVEPSFRLEKLEDNRVAIVTNVAVRAFGVGTQVRPGGVVANVYCMCLGGSADRGCTVVVAGNRVTCVEAGCSSCTLVVARPTSLRPVLTLAAGRIAMGEDVDADLRDDGSIYLRDRTATVRKAGSPVIKQTDSGGMKLECKCAKGRGGCAIVVEGNDAYCRNSKGSACEECRLTATIE